MEKKKKILKDFHALPQDDVPIHSSLSTATRVTKFFSRIRHLNQKKSIWKLAIVAKELCNLHEILKQSRSIAAMDPPDHVKSAISEFDKLIELAANINADDIAKEKNNQT
jgi:hypothetical protein